MMREIIIAGAGTGSITPEVQEALLRADVICASERFTSLIPEGRRYIPLKHIDESLTQIAHESGRVMILVSGDPGLYSLLPLVKRRFPDELITVLPGISSIQALCARVGESWSDAVILSGHGRNLNAGRFLNLVERNRLVILFCDKTHSPQWACERLSGISGVDVVIGENLGSESELVLSGLPADFVNHDSPELSLMLVRNSSPYVPDNLHPRDSEFVRAEGVVMTNESVRAVILGRLDVRRESVFWDIGAGTGSISVCVGLERPECEVHSVEYKPDAVRVIAMNAAKFHLHNIAVHEGRALDVIYELPVPSHVFIGGSEGELAGILEHIARLDTSVHVVAACVTLETFSTAYTLMKGLRDFEAVQVSVNEAKYLTPSSTLMKPKCPVVILLCNM